MGAAAISAVLRPLAGPDVPCRSLPPPAAAAAQWVHPWGAARPVACCLPRRCHWQLHAAAGDSLPGASSSSSSGSSPSSMLSSGLSGAAPPGFLQNPAIAQREALRLFFSATTVEAQQRVLEEAADLVDLGTRCGSVLCWHCRLEHCALHTLQAGTWGRGWRGAQEQPVKPTQAYSGPPPRLQGMATPLPRPPCCSLTCMPTACICPAAHVWHAMPLHVAPRCCIAYEPTLPPALQSHCTRPLVPTATPARSLQLLCHMAEQAQRGLLPGTLHEQVGCGSN